MKSLSIICGIAVLLSLMAVPAFPLSYEFDFDDDGVWDTAWSLTQEQTVEVKIWLDDYSEETLFGGQLYFQYDQSKILVNEAHSYPNDNDHGGPFDHSFSKIGKEENGVYELSLAHFDSVSVSNSKILLFSIELECIVAGADVAIKAANDLGFDTDKYDNGYVVYFVEDEQGGKEAVYVYPDDAVCESTTASSTTTSTEPPAPSTSSSTTTSTLPPPPPTSSSSSTTTSIINSTECTSDLECDDGIFCNGAETCMDGTCRPGTDPCPAGTECSEAADACITQTPVPEVLVKPDRLRQSRWIPLPVFLSITGSNTHFDSSSSVTFNPVSAIWALPHLVVDEDTIFIIGLLMPSRLVPVSSVDVTVTTGSEEVVKNLNIELFSSLLDQGKDLM